MKRSLNWALIALFAVALLTAGWLVWRQWQTRQEQAQQVLRTAPVTQGPIRETVLSTGRVIPNFEVEIKAKASGTIVRLPHDVSETVHAGELLVQLDPLDESRNVQQSTANLSSLQADTARARNDLSVAARTLTTELERAQATLKSTQARAAETRARRTRLDQLYKGEFISRDEYDTGLSAALQAEAEVEAARVRFAELRTQRQALTSNRQTVASAQAQTQASRVTLLNAQRRLGETRIVSPIDGVVTSLNVQIGTIIASGISNVGGGTALMTVADVSHLYVLASVDESDIGKVRVGQAVDITADAFAGEHFKGRVELIAAKGLNVNNVITFEVKIRVEDGQAAQLKPEMTANVSILVAQARDAVLLPADAVNQDDRGAYVQRVLPGKKAVPKNVKIRRVTTGLKDGINVQVLSGLTVGDRVVLGNPEERSKWRKPGSGGKGGGGNNAQGSQLMMKSMGK